MSWRRLLPVAALASFAAGIFLAPPAQATFHFMKIREVHPGGASGGSYVVLQMWTGNQNFVAGHDVVVYDAGGSEAHSFAFPGNVDSGLNQATILLAGEGYASAFPGGPAPDATDAALDLPSSGAAVCFADASPPDCVAWGNFAGAGSLPSASGTPVSAAGVTAGKALHRSIEPGCETLLEPGDDTDDSATDFSEQAPNPRSNSSPIVEGACPPPPDETPPNTTIDTRPPDPSGADVSFTYHSSEGGSSFECSLGDSGVDDFLGCSAAGKSYTDLADGEYTFKVRAKDGSGNLDPTPASYSWTVDTSVVAIDPIDPSGDGDEASPTAPSPAPLLSPLPVSGTAVVAGVATVKGAVAFLRTACRGPLGARCAGAFRLLARAGSGRRARRARTQTIGAGRYSLVAGSRRVVRARLTSLGRRLVRRAKRRGLRTQVVGKGVKSRVLTLRAARRRQRPERRRGARASAFHLIKVREVHAGSADDSYVVLQMLAPGENFVGGRRLRLYDATGATLHTFTFDSAYVAPSGSHGNNTILVGDTAVQATFGVSPDDHADSEFEIPAGGGAVCWLSGSPPDCVAWGNFGGGGALPVPGAGSPADPAGIPTGMALRRTIARGCPTLLEALDDTDDSASDFSAAPPAPRPNSQPPVEHPCTGTGGVVGGGGAADGGGSAGTGTGIAPWPRRLRAKIVRGPGRVTRDRTPTFRFRTNAKRAAFRCRLDGKRARRCRSPFTTRRLRHGCHVFRLRVRLGRRTGRTVVYRFRVVKRRTPGLRQFRRCRRPMRKGATR